MKASKSELSFVDDTLETGFTTLLHTRAALDEGMDMEDIVAMVVQGVIDICTPPANSVGLIPSGAVGFVSNSPDVLVSIGYDDEDRAASLRAAGLPLDLFIHWVPGCIVVEYADGRMGVGVGVGIAVETPVTRTVKFIVFDPEKGEFSIELDMDVEHGPTSFFLPPLGVQELVETA